uniref:Hexosyltransferase n=2 Tax=Arion vulgaris TaxID=1028688 RepID=A0A0B6ZXB8_9EUPU
MMRRIHWNLFLLIAGFFIATHTLLFYLNACTQQTNNSFLCMKTSRYIVPDSQNHVTISELITKTMQSNKWTTEKKLNNVSCEESYRKMNVTSLSESVRSEIGYFETSLRKIEYKNNLIPDRPENFFQIKKEIVQNLVEDYIIIPNINCPYLVAIQPSLFDRQYERDDIRQTWASVAKEQIWPNRKVNADVKVVFVVARQIETDHISTVSSLENSTHIITESGSDIYLESAMHGDILYLDMEESYRNLTLKVLSAFKWVRDSCPCVKFVLKVDYDTFVNIPLLVDTLIYFENRLENSILGMIYTAISFVSREGRWGVNSSLYPMRSFPEYASGCGYVLSFQAMSKIVEKVPYFLMLPVEDVFITGVMRRVAELDMFSLGMMFTHYLDKSWNKCSMIQSQKILGTGDAGKRHIETWDAFVKNKC